VTASVEALIFGATVAIAIGPIALLILNVSAVSGLAPGSKSALGAAMADLTYALVSFLGGHAVAPLIAVRAGAARSIAGLVLVVFAVWIALRALRRHAPGVSAVRSGSLPRPLVTTYVLTIANPLTVLLFSGFALQLPVAGSVLTSVWLSFCLFLGSLSVQISLALGGAGLGRCLVRPAWLTAFNLASAAGIALFGVRGVLEWLRG
jgi:threonine/homoserine/homoserine lactone efflux protein